MSRALSRQHAPAVGSARAHTLTWRIARQRCPASLRDRCSPPTPTRQGGRRPGASVSAADTPMQQAQQQEPRVVQLKAVDITEEAFRQFGQLVPATDDGKEFDQEDAQLDLSAGQPRFYIMRLPHRGRRFDRITYHANVTQCLGGLQPASPWFLVVAAPSGSVERYPQQQDLAAFRIPHGVFVKLHKGTWHAGPLFDGEAASFYNLELSDTNVVDHNTHDYGTEQGLAFEVAD